MSTHFKGVYPELGMENTSNSHLSIGFRAFITFLGRSWAIEHSFCGFRKIASIFMPALIAWTIERKFRRWEPRKKLEGCYGMGVLLELLFFFVKLLYSRCSGK